MLGVAYETKTKRSLTTAGILYTSDVLFNSPRDLRFAGADLRSREAFFLRKRVLQESRFALLE